ASPPLLISGTKNPVTHGQIEYMKKRVPGLKSSLVDPVTGKVSGTVTGQTDMIVLDIRPGSSPGRALKHLLREAFLRLGARRNFIICGGETSSGILSLLEAEELRLKGRVEEGIAILGNNKYNFILKPGGFGRPDSLFRSYNALVK
ncbi:MAG TPA: nucleotide-binding domain containing protein, partial [bacterium]|nr:nucleotide-binding domain containing protein [bacterium]